MTKIKQDKKELKTIWKAAILGLLLGLVTNIFIGSIFRLIDLTWPEYLQITGYIILLIISGVLLYFLLEAAKRKMGIVNK